MADSVILKITEKGAAAPKALTRCVSFRYIKEFYTPYSQLSAVFLPEGEVGEILMAELYVNGFFIHRGLVDSAEVRTSPGEKRLVLASRGFSSLLAQNQVTPGTYPGMTLNTLMDTLAYLPHISHEDVPAPVDFLYVGYGTSLWEGIAALCLKQLDTRPYVAHTNTVRFTVPSARKSIALSQASDRILSYGWEYDTSRLVSGYHMMDALGSYNTFNRSESAVTERGILRRRHVPFDEQWAPDAQRGLGHRLGFDLRGFRGFSVRYLGYRGEDLCDLFSFEQGAFHAVSRLEVRGGTGGVSTRLTAYFDRYLNGGA